MKIKTNQPQFRAFCDDLNLHCELITGDDNAEPFIFIEGALVTKLIELTKSPKFIMLKKILG